MQSYAPEKAGYSLPTADLPNSDARFILCYPTCDRARDVADQLKHLGIVSVEFTGNTIIGKHRILGKGYVGLVIKGILSSGQAVAVKIRRLDADRATMINEAKHMELANAYNIGPKLYTYSQDVLVMELVIGQEVDEFIRTANGESIRSVVKEILNQCWTLDTIGLSHGELSTLRKHVVISPQVKPVILDFESASIMRKSSNLTAATQYLLVSGPSSPIVREVLSNVSKEEVIDSLRLYKKTRSKASYTALLTLLGLL